MEKLRLQISVACSLSLLGAQGWIICWENNTPRNVGARWRWLVLSILKGTLHPQIKIHIFPLTFSAIHQSTLFWLELSSCGDDVTFGCT